MNGTIRITDLGLGNQDLASIGKLDETGLTPEQIAYNIKYGVHDIKNNDNENIKISISSARKSWTKALAGFTGIIAIEIIDAYLNSDVDSILNLQIIESDINKPARTITLSGKWDKDSTSWQSGYALDSTSFDYLEIRFAKDVSNNKAYILLGDPDSIWSNLKVRIDMPLGELTDLYNLSFGISKLSNLATITTDITKVISTVVIASELGTFDEFTTALG